MLSPKGSIRINPHAMAQGTSWKRGRKKAGVEGGAECCCQDTVTGHYAQNSLQLYALQEIKPAARVGWGSSMLGVSG